MKRAIVFVDANNWYHNVKRFFTPSDIDIEKLARFLCRIKNYELEGIRWYASVPNIADGPGMYYRHMSFNNKETSEIIKQRDIGKEKGYFRFFGSM